jgi:glutathione S-transferase
LITVHHLNNSRSQRILWLLEELGLPYEIRSYTRDRETLLAPPELLAIHPLGKSPVITEEGAVVAESGAIIEYVLERHGAGRLVPPPGTTERLRYTYWLHFAEGTAMPTLVQRLIFNRIERGPLPFFARPIARGIARRVSSLYIEPNLERQIAYMEAELGAHEWFAGSEFTAADIQMGFPVEAARARAGLDERRPNLLRFLERIRARPAYQRALERGGAFALR